jgi:hypothetical protein
MTHAEATRILATARSASEGKPIATHTRLIDRGEYIAVRYHATDVVCIYPDGTYVLNSGGWWTNTTKKRFNTYSPIRVWQTNHNWHVYTPGGPVQFRDGIRVDSNGSVIN